MFFHKLNFELMNSMFNRYYISHRTHKSHTKKLREFGWKWAAHSIFLFSEAIVMKKKTTTTNKMPFDEKRIYLLCRSPCEYSLQR